MAVLINTIYKKLKDILSKDNYFLIKDNQVGGASKKENKSALFFKNEMSNYEWRYSIIDYFILYQIIEKNLIEENKDIMDLLNQEVNIVNITDIVNKLQVLTVNLIMTNIINKSYLYTETIQSKDMNLSYYNLITDSDLIYESENFNFVYNKSSPIYLTETLETIINRNNKLYLNVKIDNDILINKFISLLNTKELINFEDFNNDIYYLYLAVNFSKNIEKKKEKYKFEETDKLKYYNYLLFSVINHKYIDLSDEKKNEINIYLLTNLKNQIDNFEYKKMKKSIINFIISLDPEAEKEFVLFTGKNTIFLNKYVELLKETNNNICIGYFDNFYTKDTSETSETPIDESVIFTNNRTYYEWYYKDGTGFDKINLDNIYINEIHNFLIEHNIFVEQIEPFELKLLILIFKEYEYQFDFLVNRIRCSVFISLKELYDPFFYIIEDMYIHYYTMMDINFMKNYIYNIVYLNSDYKYIYEYLKSHGAGNYISNKYFVEDEKKEKLTNINNIKVHSFKANMYYRFIMKMIKLNEFIIPNPNLYVYKKYVDLGTFYGENYNNIIETLYFSIINYYSFYTDKKPLSDTGINDTSEFKKLLNKIYLPFQLNKYTSIFEIIQIDDEMINFIKSIVKDDELNFDDDLFLKKKKNLEFLINDINKNVFSTQDEINNINNKINMYNDEIEHLEKKLEKNIELYNISKIEWENYINYLIDEGNTGDDLSLFNNKKAFLENKIATIKEENNYDVYFNNLEIKKKEYEKVKFDYDINLNNYNTILQYLKDKYLEIEDENKPELITPETDISNINDNLLIDLYNLSLKDEYKIDSFVQLDSVINEDLIFVDNDSPYIILYEIVAQLFTNKNELLESKKRVLDEEIQVRKMENSLYEIDLKYKKIYDEIRIIDLIMYNYTNTKETINQIENEIIKKNEAMEMLIEQNNIINLDLINKTNESKILINNLNNLLEKFEDNKNIELINKIKTVKNEDLYIQLNKLFNNYNYKDNVNYEILLYKFIYLFPNIRIVLYDYTTTNLIKYYENPEVSNKINLLNIYISYNKSKKLFYILNISDYRILINDMTLFSDLFINLEKIYLKIHSGHKKRKNELYNKFLMSIAEKKFVGFRILKKDTDKIILDAPAVEIKETIDLFINKIIKLLNIPFIYIHDNNLSLQNFYYLLFYMLINYEKDFQKETLNRIKYYIIIILLLRNGNKNLKYYKNIELQYLMALFIKNENFELIKDFNPNGGGVIKEFNNLLGIYYNDRDIDGNYRFVIESYFKTPEGAAELHGANKFKGFYLIDKNGRKIINNEILLQLITSIFYNTLYDKFIFKLYPLDGIVEYYRDNIFPRYVPELSDELKYGIIIMEYWQVIQICNIANIEFTGETGFFDEYFNIIDELYNSYLIYGNGNGSKDKQIYYKTAFNYLKHGGIN